MTTSAARPFPVDEMFCDPPSGWGKTPHSHCHPYWAWLSSQPPEVIARAQAEADLFFRRVGITFNVYGDEAGTERLIPFDVIPRILAAGEWRELEKGLRQRVLALNRFIHDVYHDQDMLRAGLIPQDLVLRNAQYRPEMKGVSVPRDVYAHISGIDIVRAGKG